MVNPLGKWQVGENCCGAPCDHCVDGIGPPAFRVTIQDWANWGGEGDCEDCASFNDTFDLDYLTTEAVTEGHRWYDVFEGWDQVCLFRHTLSSPICGVTEIELAITFDVSFKVRIWVALFENGMYVDTCNVYDAGDLGYPADCTNWVNLALHFLDIWGPCDNTGGTGYNVLATALAA